MQGELAGLSVGYGRRAVSQNAEPPRVVLARARDSYGPAQRSGGNARVLLTRDAAVEVFLWGRTEDEVEELSNSLVRALRASCGPNFAASGLEWSGAEYLERGAFAVFTGSVAIPVTDTAAPVAPVTEVALDPSGPSTTGDGALDSPEV